MQQCLKPYGCGDTSKTVLKIVCFGKSVFCRKNRDAPIVLNVTVSAATNRRDPRGYNAACKVATLRNSAERGTQSHRLCPLPPWLAAFRAAFIAKTQKMTFLV